MPLPLLIAGAAALGGLAKVLGVASENDQEKKKMLASLIGMRYSPYTGQKAEFYAPKHESPVLGFLGGAAQGALSGAALGNALAGGGTPAATDPTAGMTGVEQDPYFSTNPYATASSGSPWTLMSDTSQLRGPFRG